MNTAIMGGLTILEDNEAGEKLNQSRVLKQKI
jgi:hypothetical protein